YVLHDGDHVGIGEHELIFRAYGSPASAVEDLPTVAVSYEPHQEATYRTRDDALATIPSSDEFGTLPSEENEVQALGSDQSESLQGVQQLASPPLTPVPEPEPVVSEPESVASPPVANVEKSAAALPPISADAAKADTNITFHRFAGLSQPALPDMGAFMAAL